MKMLDWDALIGEREAVENGENSPSSGELPHCFSADSEIVGKPEANNSVPYKATSPLSPPSPLKKQGGRLETENETRARGGATDNLSDKKSHPVSPLAVSLLLACCHQIAADEQETIEAILSLRHCTPAEQVQSWALLCSDNGIDPNQVHAPVMSPGEGVACRGCQHLGAGWVHRPGICRVFRFTCDKRHAMLELGYAGERVLVAPPECSDYADGTNWKPVNDKTVWRSPLVKSDNG
jgi:hypothetical protein